MHEDFVGVLGNGTAVVQFTNKGKAQETKPTQVIVEPENSDVYYKVASWGKDNNLPQLILKTVRKNGAATSGLSVMKDVHYGGGFMIFKETYKEEDDFKRKIVPQSFYMHPEIRKFFRKNQMKRFFKDVIADLEYFAIAFPEYILSNDYSKITEVRRQKAAHCRFELMDEKTGFIKNVYISTKWGDKHHLDLESKYVSKVPLIDSYWSADQVKEYCKANKIRKFIRPMFYTMLDESYYPIASWQAAYYSKWIDIANSIPEFKKALFENQMSIKYHIEVDEEYFQLKYEDNWDDFSPEERSKKRKEFADFIDKKLRGVENSGSSIWSMLYGNAKGEKLSSIKINTIDDKFKEGAFLPDGQTANEETLSAISVDVALIGQGVPGGQGAGSGSDKREAWLILTARAKTKRETTVEAFEFIQDYNEWDETLIGGFEDTILTTLDKNPKGQEKTANV